MNPYDFVRIAWENPPQRKEPLWHHRLITTGSTYSGRIEVQIEAERPIFLPNPEDIAKKSRDPKRPIPFQYVERGSELTYVIPGSSLKGMIRTVAETLGNGCLTLFDETYEYKHIREKIYEDFGDKIPGAFKHCYQIQRLCVACRIFGMMERGRNAQVFLGKVNISDAYSVDVIPNAPLYTIALMNPKPHHEAFYLDQERRRIAGRKFYFHHDEPMSHSGLQYIPGNREPINRYIQPLGPQSRFHFSINFTNLEPDEFAVLLVALVLRSDMRHKIGYGKPMGLGSVYLSPITLSLTDYVNRYALREHKSENTQKSVLTGKGLEEYIDSHIKKYAPAILKSQAMEDLKRIWQWPPLPGKYQYPDKAWFDRNPVVSIQDTP